MYTNEYPGTIRLAGMASYREMPAEKAGPDGDVPKKPQRTARFVRKGLFFPGKSNKSVQNALRIRVLV
jgi:hypothetical protein